jgi:hypothetical protein
VFIIHVQNDWFFILDKFFDISKITDKVIFENQFLLVNPSINFHS